MSDQTSSPAGPPGASAGGPTGASKASAGVGLAAGAAQAKVNGATNAEAATGAIKRGAQMAADKGIKKATGSEIAVDALHSAQKLKSGDAIGGAQDLAASGANAGVTAAVGLTGVGAPVAGVAGSLAGSLVKSKAGRYAISAVLALVLLVGVVQVGTIALLTVGATGAISAVIGDDATSETECSDGSAGAGAGSAQTSLTGTGIEQKAWNFLTGKGLTPEQAAGVMGNIKRESQFNPFLAENVTSTPNVSRGWGLVQWTAGRHAQIRDAVLADPSLGSSMYVSAPSYSAMPAGMAQEKIDQMTLFQLNYIMMELDGAEKVAGQKLRGSTTVRDATANFEKYYERAGVVKLEERVAHAESYYNQFKGTSGGTGGGTTAGQLTPGDSGNSGAGTTAGQTQPDPNANAGVDADDLTPVGGYDVSAMRTALIIYQTIKDEGGSDQAAALAITTAIGESSLGTNKKAMTQANGDGDQGLYQMRVQERDGAYYGTPEQVQDTEWSTRAWYKGIDTHAGHMKGLLDVKGWEGMAPEIAIHKVQGNAASTNFVYADNYAVAQEIFSAVSGIDASSLLTGSVGQSGQCGNGGDPAAGASLITGDNAGPVNAAMSLLPHNYPYVFGGGNQDGPSGSKIESKDAGEAGFDCSSVTQFSYKQGAGIQLPRTARAQWAAYQGNRVDASQIQPGDLIFWAYGRLGSTVSHVAIYVGNGQMIEASRGANIVKITPARLSGSGFVGVARVLDSGAAQTAGSAAGDTKV